MPSLIEYEIVLSRMQALGLRCQYFNSGAFNFEDAAADFVGWLVAEDASIRPAARERAQIVAPPHEATLAHLAMQAWNDLFPGPIWIMPKSQWGYELDFGSKAWLPDALKLAGVDPAPLQGRTDSPAIEFSPGEQARVRPLVQSLLENLLGSDFALAFPDHPVACTLHHHKQIWWISRDASAIERLRLLPQDR